MMPYIKRIAEDWIATHSDDSLVGSWRDPLLLIEVVIESNPSWGWFIITSIIDMDASGSALTDLVHGPLESWINKHADSTIELIEEEARSNSRFRRALRGLGNCQNESSIWKRIKIAAEGD
jgi:hypothetical protein